MNISDNDKKPASIPKHDELIIVVGSILAAIFVATMAVLAAIGGVSQETFQIAAPVSDFATALRDGAQSMRLQYAVDDLFIAAYTVVFVFVASWCPPTWPCVHRLPRAGCHLR